MPRTRKSPEPDIDFNIFVDPSCLSAPMDDETPLPQIIATATRDITPIAVEAVEAEECDEIKDIHPGPSRGFGMDKPRSAMEGTATVEDSIDDLLEEIGDADYDGRSGREEVQNAEKDVTGGGEEDSFDGAQHEDEHEEGTLGDERHEQEEPAEVSAVTDDSLSKEDKQPVELDEHTTITSRDEVDVTHDDEISLQEESYQDEPSTLDESGIDEVDQPAVDNTQPEREPEFSAKDHSDDDVPAEHNDSCLPSRRSSAQSTIDRRGSLRTEALIQAAARAVVAQIEERAIAAVESHRASLSPSNVHEQEETSVISNRAAEANLDERTSPSRRHSASSTASSQIRHHLSSDEANSASSHHDSDPDVFSDRGGSSARSSLSWDGSHHHPSGDDEPRKTHVNATPKTKSRLNSPRLSGVSSLSQYEQDEEKFTPTTRSSRSTPRMPFRTPSDVRALQMSSPTPSVFNGSSPRPTKRNAVVPYVGSPTVSAQYQYSPKSRSPHPRFKTRKEAAPLVLLHVTLLPLRWGWGEVVDGVDDAATGGFKASDELKGLRDAWRQLRDRVGDTVLERGVLLPHPQNDYEVLEERLLEALELPLRRRARILECGHYLGPANEMADDADEGEESEAEEEYNLQTGRFEKRRHWCGTCKGEIKYEDLGPGKVFRVKVYASNGLMKAGAWEACWKEMERVDVEVEPIVEGPLHRELERLAAFRVEREEEERSRHEEALRAEEEVRLPTPQYLERGHPDIFGSPSPVVDASPPTPIRMASSVMSSPHEEQMDMAVDMVEARRRREEERLREIYGSVPPPAPEFEPVIPSSVRAEPPTSTFPTNSAHHTYEDTSASTDSYIPAASPRSPSEEAAERRTQRRTGAYQSASLPELVFEAIKVWMWDRKNVAIAVLGVFVLLLAMKPSGPGDVTGYKVEVPAPAVREGILPKQEGFAVDTLAFEALEDVAVLDVPIVEKRTGAEADNAEMAAAGVVPSLEPQPEVELPSVSSIEATSSSSPPEETVTEKKVVRVVETVTETVKVSVTATESVILAQETQASVTVVARGDVAEDTPADTDGAKTVASFLGFETAVCPLRMTDVCVIREDLEDLV